jgi:hypothetical protein
MLGRSQFPVRRLPRPAQYLAAALALAAALPASAHAADFYAAHGAGAGTCTSAGAPCSVEFALRAAAASPGADVVNLAAGQYMNPVIATDPALGDVTLRGAGKRQTLISAPATDGPVVDLGSGAGGSMTLEDLAIDAPGSAMFSAGVRARLARLALRRVRIIHTWGPNGKAVPAIDAPAASTELVLDAVDVTGDTEGYDPAVGVVTAGGPLTIRDSTIRGMTGGATSTVVARGDVTILRSTITHREVNAGSALHAVGPDAARTVTVDSSLLTGGNTSVLVEAGSAATQVALRGVTLAPSWDSNGWSVDITGGAGAHAGIDNSLLVTRPVRTAGGAVATCSWSNVSPVADGSGPQSCSVSAGNPGSNTGLRDDELRLDKDFAPRADSPLIDSASPGGVAPGESPTDRLGRPRAAASDDSCEAGGGRRDKGAFERYRPKPSVTIVGADRFPAGSTQFTANTNAIDPFFVWSFDDESTGQGERTTSHTFATGRSRVTLEVTDRAYGCTTRVTKDVTVTAAATASATARDRTAPRLTKVGFVRATIKRRRNASLRFTLSEKATVTITVARRKGKRLVATRKVTYKGRKGRNRVTLSAKRLGLRRTARFRVLIGAKDGAGNAAKRVPRRLVVR